MGPAPNGVAGATIALVALFLPGFLILIGALPFWDQLRRKTWAQSAMQGANAAVVGILGAALYSPVFTSAIGGMPDFALALICFVALMAWKALPWVAVWIGRAHVCTPVTNAPFVCRLLNAQQHLTDTIYI